MKAPVIRFSSSWLSAAFFFCLRVIVLPFQFWFGLSSDTRKYV